MKNSTKLLVASALGSVLAMSTAGTAHAAKSGMEKCYGVAKAGKNDCGTDKHSCAAQAKTDGDKTEWIYVPKGTCDKLVGGSLKK
ncbi:MULTISPECIES: DUF2282 domain-containing protein [Endozoicomonas]|uniref:Uncharacterized protein n=1 Tax=Endozoicomonas numazuensis TaxID=1137799 RepID=A0A081NIT1_9GAMM|nr:MULTISPECIES: DUF2282 domain-containing protein [Endozoicomonas]KEQ18354.1 hypothetical protein GZ78_12655 [Endozoicomonas numazuensis]